MAKKAKVTREKLNIKHYPEMNNVKKSFRKKMMTRYVETDGRLTTVGQDLVFVTKKIEEHYRECIKLRRQGMNDEQMYYYLMEEHSKSTIDNKIIRAIFIDNTPQLEV